jgi:hypothetical protein
MIKYYTFYRENNKFDDILSDQTIKKLLKMKVFWYQYMMVGIEEHKNEQTFSYITLKYGDDIKSPDVKDFTPVPGVDYVPKKDKTKFKKRIT